MTLNYRNFMMSNTPRTKLSDEILSIFLLNLGKKSIDYLLYNFNYYTHIYIELLKNMKIKKELNNIKY